MNFKRLLILLLLIVLSIGVGIGFDAVATAIEMHAYPINDDFREDISANADEFGIPEPILWGFIHTQSAFSSNKVSNDGSIGLSQLTPEEFQMIQTQLLKEGEQSSDMLYSPKVNLRCGAAYLSFLYHRYGAWLTAFAAYEVGTDTVDTWLSDPDLVDEHGMLKAIPEASVAELASKALDACDTYSRLYFES